MNGMASAPRPSSAPQNYVDLLDDDSFYTSLKNNIIWLVLYLLAIPAGLAVALFLNQTVAGIRLYKSLFFFPFVISQVVVGLISQLVLRAGFRPVAASHRLLHGFRNRQCSPTNASPPMASLPPGSGRRSPIA